MKATTTKIRKGSYRVNNYTSGSQITASVVKDRLTGKWEAAYRDAVTAEIIRYAGIWNTRRDAVLEVSRIVERGFF
jgi:hypothetical protein